MNKYFVNYKMPMPKHAISYKFLKRESYLRVTHNTNLPQDFMLNRVASNQR